MFVQLPRFMVLTLLNLTAVGAGVEYAADARTMNDEPRSAVSEQQSPVAEQQRGASPIPGPGRMSVIGRVLDPTGKPVPGAMIMVHAWTLDLGGSPYFEGKRQIPIGNAQADRLGRFQVDAPRTSSSRHESFGAVALAPGFGAGWVELDPDADQPTADIFLRPEQVIQGRLFDSQGRPVAGVTLSVLTFGLMLPQAKAQARSRFDGVSYGARIAGDFPAWPKAVTTDPEGRFTLRGVGRGLHAALAVHHPRFALQTVEVETDLTSGQKTVTAALVPSQVVQVRVTYGDTGKPVPHARLRLMASRGRGARVDEAETDAEGRTNVNSWPADRTYGFIAFPPEGQPYLRASGRVDWPKGALEQSIDLALPRGALIRGKVAEEGSGKPVAGATVDFMPRTERQNQNDESILARTTPDGSFQLGAKPGPGYLFIRGPSDDFVHEEIGQKEIERGRLGGPRIYTHAHVSLDIKPGTDPKEINLALRRGMTVSGQVVGPDGQPVQDAWIITRGMLDPRIGTRRMWNIRFHGNVRAGHFELHGLDPDVETPVYFINHERRLGAVVNLSGKSVALMMIENRPGRLASGARNAFQDRSKVRGPINVRLESCGAAMARFVDSDGEPVVAHIPRDVSITMVVTDGLPYGKAMENAGVPCADEAALNQVDPIN
jgi:protocatechuate 3,4-dioxygenase beta subunit